MICIQLSFNESQARLDARPAHRDRLAALHAEGRLLAAGPWSDDSGALIVLTTGEAEAREIMAADPFYSTPGVTVAAVREWNPVVGPAPV
ncbi:MAG TPA: YciI family protein [Mycobacteriales bacterium]|nr:YciI family protein [Mycobacteriales bacterium]